MAETRFPIWANTFIPDIGNGDSNIVDPGEPKQESGFIVEKPLVQEMNWILRELGRYLTANNSVRVVSTGYESKPGDILRVNNSSAPASVLLPDTPLDRQWVIIGATDKIRPNTVTVDGNGNDIMITADQLCVLNMNNTMFLFNWNADENMWKINIWGINGRAS